jgi:death-on-curing family protein
MLTGTEMETSSTSLHRTPSTSRKHTFLDGNKRTGVATALTFLELNGKYQRPDEEEFHEAMIAVADKRMTKTELGAYLRRLGMPPA